MCVYECCVSMYIFGIIKALRKLLKPKAQLVLLKNEYKYDNKN